MNRVIWHSDIATLPQQPTKSLELWLTKPSILSQALKCHCQHLSVEVLSQDFSAVDSTEQKLVEDGKDPFVRRVFLLGDNEPWTYGRVVIAPSTYDVHFSKFISLGSKLLGETLLYNNPDTTRSRFEYAAFSADTPLYQEIQQHLQLTLPTLWGRRSYFYLKEAPLLVTEVFLPALPDYEA
ncbi:MAG: chorismate lyase [Candidatus Berkiella sp.]